MSNERQKFGENGVFRIQVFDPERLLRFAMTDLYCRHKEPFADPMYVPQWKPDYDEIADWLRDNEGKGLLISGSVGNGKTMMIRSVLPFLINRMFGRVVHYCQATQMASDEEVRRRKGYKVVLDAVDDLGTPSAGSHERCRETRHVRAYF